MNPKIAWGVSTIRLFMSLSRFSLKFYLTETRNIVNLHNKTQVDRFPVKLLDGTGRVQRSGLEKSQTARINVMLASSWFQNHFTQQDMTGIPEFNQNFRLNWA